MSTKVVLYTLQSEASTLELEGLMGCCKREVETPFPLKWENSKSQILQNSSNRCTISCYLARIELNLVECILNLGSPA
jgi:hypothetical protein